jgi:DNA-binding PadR family transcriptional regulator
MEAEKAGPPAGELPMNPMEHLVLTVLLDGPRHGYGIAGEIDRRSGGAVAVHPGNLYRVLDRLLQRALIAEVEPENGAGGRRDYRVTGAGKAMVEAEDRLRRRMRAASAGLRKLTEPV